MTLEPWKGGPADSSVEGWEREVWIPGRPRGKGRPRFSPVGGGGPRSTTGPRVRVHTDPRDVVAENWAKACWLGRYPGLGVLEGPLSVSLEVRVPLPAPALKAERGRWADWRTAAGLGLVHPVGKPDADNLAKLYLDGLNGVAWVDDVQVVRLGVVKVWADGADDVGVWVRVCRLVDRVARPG